MLKFHLANILHDFTDKAYFITSGNEFIRNFMAFLFVIVIL